MKRIQTWESKSDFTVQIQKRKRIRKWPHHRDNSAVLRNESSGSCLRIISIRFSVHQCKNLHIFAILTFWVLLLQQPATRPASKRLQTAAAFISWSVVTAYAFVPPSLFSYLYYTPAHSSPWSSLCKTEEFSVLSFSQLPGLGWGIAASQVANQQGLHYALPAGAPRTPQHIWPAADLIQT